MVLHLLQLLPRTSNFEGGCQCQDFLDENSRTTHPHPRFAKSENTLNSFHPTFHLPHPPPGYRLKFRPQDKKNLFTVDGSIRNRIVDILPPGTVLTGCILAQDRVETAPGESIPGLHLIYTSVRFAYFHDNSHGTMALPRNISHQLSPRPISSPITSNKSIATLPVVLSIGTIRMTSK
jgi:hypothetical protein